MFLFPFASVPKDCNVILYGAGDVGRQYIKQIQLTGWCSIIAVADQNWRGIKRYDVQICAPDAIDYKAADAVIIAVEDLHTAESIKEILKKKEANNIVWQILRYNGADEYAHLTEYDSYVFDKDTERAQCLEMDERKGLGKLLAALKLYSYPNMSLIRVGGDADGGYIMDEITSDHVAYSIGIGQEISWDADMAGRNFDLYMYDYTVDHLPYHNNRFHFFKKGITGTETNDPVFCTLQTALKANGHDKQKHLILKMDIEGAEWPVFENISEELLDGFDQMVFEIHGLMKKNKWEYYAECLERLNRTHVLVHVHGNNACRYALIDGLRLPDCIELSYVKRTNKDYYEDNAVLPRSLDRPNVKGLDEIALGDWNTWINRIVDICK